MMLQLGKYNILGFTVFFKIVSERWRERLPRFEPGAKEGRGGFRVVLPPEKLTFPNSNST